MLDAQKSVLKLELRNNDLCYISIHLHNERGYHLQFCLNIYGRYKYIYINIMWYYIYNIIKLSRW